MKFIFFFLKWSSFITSYWCWNVICSSHGLLFVPLFYFFMFLSRIRQLSMVGYLEICLMIFPASMSMESLCVRWGKIQNYRYHFAYVGYLHTTVYFQRVFAETSTSLFTIISGLYFDFWFPYKYIRGHDLLITLGNVN